MGAAVRHDHHLQRAGPALGLNALICIEDLFPAAIGAGGPPAASQFLAFPGQVLFSASATLPAGWALANGASLDCGSNMPLYSLIDYAFGGSGNYFLLPDLRAMAITGA